MPTLVAYLLVFVFVGIGFVLINLTVGTLIRPKVKNAEKDIPYECGEDPVGSSWVQFDLRFYVVALLFVIFEVELVFFFPWATLFGKLNTLSVPTTPTAAHDLLVKSVAPLAPAGSAVDPDSALASAWLIFGEMVFFLAILLVAYAYLWRQGDLNWVRASSVEQAKKRVMLPMAELELPSRSSL
ncbi:MAG TPA: NADH-quinone oxidoreductase subunit A [Gemmatales bacterium]|nr:NADH-quinone oxidoreductase subunit A [Gemmatales bacterium]